MNLKMIYVLFVPIFVVFVLCSAIVLGKASNTPMLIITGALFLATIAVEDKLDRRIYFPLVLFFLGAFHWFSHLNWCFSLYWISSIKPIYQSDRLRSSFTISIVFSLLYTVIRLSYVPGNAYDLLISFADIFTACLIVLFVRYIKASENEKQSLKEANNHFQTHDPLTDLLNYQEYHKQVDKLINEKLPFVHLLIDCTNFRAMNDEQGVQTGNETLIKIARTLTTSFGDDKLISRYQGDQFAVCLPLHITALQQIFDILDSIVTHWVELKFIFCYTVYPEEATSASDLFSLTEDKLYQIKRENWLKREEHLFRSEKLSVIGELAAGMAHEIRNPLTTINGFLQLAAKSNEYNIKPWYEIMESEVIRMSELTAEFLQFSKPHIANMKTHILQDCIHRVIHLTESQALLYGHEVRYDKQLPPVYIEMDKDKIVQVLLNLVKNALEAMKENGIVTIRLMNADNKQALVEIEDTGKGIPESELTQIFNPFYTTKSNGTGLGLSICHKIIEDHRGTIQVHSVINRGTTFRITLPVSSTK